MKTKTIATISATHATVIVAKNSFGTSYEEVEREDVVALIAEIRACGVDVTETIFFGDKYTNAFVAYSIPA